MGVPDLAAQTTLELEGTLVSLQHIQDGKYLFLCALTILLYDHLLTLSEEVETVWKRKKTWILYLFLIVRYYAILAVVIVAFGRGYFSTEMTRERWMFFLPLGITMPLTILPGVLMIVRVYALWDRNRFVLYGLCTYLVAQMCAGLWQYTVSGGTPAPLPLDNYEYHFCIYLPPKSIGRASTMFVLMELTFDSIIFLLTITRTIYMYTRHRHTTRIKDQGSGLIENLVRDGAFYFGVIFSFNLSWVLMILYAPTNLRAIASIPSSCVTTIMICRITLNLRTTVYGPARVDIRTMANSYPLADVGSGRRPRNGRSSTADRLEIGVHIETEFEGDSDQDVKPTTSTGIDGELPFSNGNGFGRTLGRTSPLPLSPAPAYAEPSSPSTPAHLASAGARGQMPLLPRFAEVEYGSGRGFDGGQAI
ncbi:hypothetical protein K488DRAFT_81545 [Vararia minispora EC-137]|uniref:Uncharacterized protein n=1 Tax=Vararia minispora EC-137 TaxID=1314806 RepID=A0ACB8QZU0_9AGAM|nr:hypothetical protein K488DRAFT_81545 [Vararia minispora EC-137]